jgi:hypothetical protein
VGGSQFEGFQSILEKYRSDFHSSRTPKSLEAHYYRMKRTGALEKPFSPSVVPISTPTLSSSSLPLTQSSSLQNTNIANPPSSPSTPAQKAATLPTKSSILTPIIIPKTSPVTTPVSPSFTTTTTTTTTATTTPQQPQSTQEQGEVAFDPLKLDPSLLSPPLDLSDVEKQIIMETDTINNEEKGTNGVQAKRKEYGTLEKHSLRDTLRTEKEYEKEREKERDPKLLALLRGRKVIAIQCLMSH